MKINAFPLGYEHMRIDDSKYDAPISIVESAMNSINMALDDACYKAVLRCGIDVDKEKLIQALNMDSNRYREAYNNGYKDALDNLVHCDQCENGVMDKYGDIWCNLYKQTFPLKGYCSNAQENEEKE